MSLFGILFFLAYQSSLVGITDLTFPVESSGLKTELDGRADTTGHLLRVHGDGSIADHIDEGWHAAQGFVEVLCPVLQGPITRTALVASVLKCSE